VFIKRKSRGGRPGLDLTKVQTGSGQTIKLGIAGLPPQAENGLKELFPNAEIAQDGGCFIATAAYGSALAPQVVTLCHFRDTRLRSRRLGRWVIGVYERCSPPLAAWIADRPTARVWVQRLLLSPAIWLVRRWLA
ncbi:MAG: hypothetical protein JXA89_11825, partial [Anaerolineae bacterium]|nr:hypothetical protein [Anaerolineae bacterium]